jgi:acetyltransferase-like isoleucine patch superfamily enzyme
MGAQRARIGLRERLQRLVQTRVWKMDIHPTARIAPGAHIDRTWPRGVHIGAHTEIGEQAVVLTHDFTRGLRADTWIGARCRIGPRAIIMAGVIVGEDCVIEPGALVNRDVPFNSIAKGNPATIEPRDVQTSPEAGEAPNSADEAETPKRRREAQA